MFYLGSIAGILPYILALSLTIIWGGHVTIPLFTSHCSVDSTIEIKDEPNSLTKSLQCIDSENQVNISNILQFFALFSISSELVAFYRTELIESTESGISCLRAPPVFEF